MLLRISLWIWAVNVFLESLLMIYHEFWHWLFAHCMRIFTLGDIHNIIFTIKEYPRIERNNIGGFTKYSPTMCITYISTIKHLKSTESKIVTFAPAIGTIILFLLTPWWMYPLYLSHINSLWLSLGDVDKLTDYWENIEQEEIK